MPTPATAADAQAELLFALQEQFPDLTADALSVDAHADAEFIRVAWEQHVALFPKSEDAAGRLRGMAAVMPHLRGFLSPAVPLWERSADTADWRRAWRAAEQPAGRILRPELIVDQNRERLVRDLAAFCHELHGFSVERARGLGAASFRAWRNQHDALAQRSLALLRPLLSWSELTWARRWWSKFLQDDQLWQIEPALVHGGLAVERLRVDPLIQQLAAVTDWQQLGVADPALDFAALIDAYGAELGWRIVEHYGELGSTADAALFRRIRLQQTVRRFRDVTAAAAQHAPDSPEMDAALNRLRPR